MKAFVVRIIAVFLVIELVADPLCQAAQGVAPFNSPAVSNPRLETFQRQAFAPVARWSLLVLPALSAYGAHLLFTRTHIPADITTGIQGHPGASILFTAVLGTLFSTGDQPTNELDIPWIGKGLYSQRREPQGYPHILSTHAEIQQLLQKPGVSVPPETPMDLSRLRTLYLAHEMQDPVKQEKWTTAAHRIGKQLNVLETRGGPECRQLIEDMIQQLETHLPLTGHKEMRVANGETTPKSVETLDNFENYMLDLEHGLLHSLIVTDRALGIAAETYAGRPDADALMQQAKRILPGIGLLHDLTGLRDRQDHHVSVQRLIRLILPEFRNVFEGPALFTPAEIDAIESGSYRHRGQKYPSPQTELEKIFKDADEVLLIDDIERVLRQPAAGAFQYRKWDIYRKYMVKEWPKFSGRGVFHHETHGADFFNYLLFTLMDRTNPANYDTPVIKEYVAKQYLRLKPYVISTMEGLIRKDVLEREGTEWEVRYDLKRVPGVILELEAMLREDSAARVALREEIGSTAELADRLANWVIHATPGPHQTWFPGPTAIAAAQLKGSEKVGGFGFNRGLDLFAFFLENPSTDIARLTSGSEQRQAKLLEGFASGVREVVRDRIRDLFGMISDEAKPVPENLDDVVANLLMEKFLYEVNQGVDIPRALDEVRQTLDSFRYGTQLPGAWDAPARNPISLMRWIRSLLTASIHNHASGHHTPEKKADYFRRDEHLRVRYHQETGLDPADPEQLRWLDYGPGPIQTAAEFEKPYGPGKFIMNNDPTLEHTRTWYADIAREAIREGHRVYGVIATFDKYIEDPMLLLRAVQAAIDGMKAGEREAQRDITGVLILGIRKDYSPEKALRAAQHWLELRRRLDPQDVWRIFGMDSVGFERDDFRPQDHFPAFELGKANGQWIKFHIGEMWSPGKLLQALRRIEVVLDSGLVRTLTNAISLCIDPRRLSALYYTPHKKRKIRDLQATLIQRVRRERLFWEDSPTSHEIVSRMSRIQEGWSFAPRSLRVPLAERMEDALLLVLTADDPGVLHTSFTEEHFMAYSGETAFGPLSYPQLQQLLKNSKFLADQVLQWIKDHNAVRTPVAVTLLAAVMSPDFFNWAVILPALAAAMITRPFFKKSLQQVNRNLPTAA